MLVVTLATAGAWEAAHAQDLPVATRGTVKVRSRVFNPFEVGQSRLAISPFGVFTLTSGSPFSLPTATSAPAAGGAEASGTDSPVALTTGETGGSLDGGIATNAVRPPFRPPTRSPWRPPPRPPFFPP